MATPSPSIDIFNPVIQRLGHHFECEYLSGIGLVGEEQNIKRVFVKCATHAQCRRVMGEVLSGGWGMGTTQLEVAEELGLERSRVSDAHRKGEMSLYTYFSIRYAECRPRDPEPTEQDFGAMNRAGFIGVAQFLGGFVRDRKQLIVSDLNEARHEMICEMLGNYHDWVRSRLRNDTRYAAELVRNVCNDRRRDIVPDWYTDREKMRIRAEVEQWKATDATAFRFLCGLQDNWEDIYVVTAQVTEEGQRVRFAKNPLHIESTDVHKQ